MRVDVVQESERYLECLRLLAIGALMYRKTGYEIEILLVVFDEDFISDYNRQG